MQSRKEIRVECLIGHASTWSREVILGQGLDTTRQYHPSMGELCIGSHDL